MAIDLERLYASADDALKRACLEEAGQDGWEELYKSATKSPGAYMKLRAVYAPMIPILEIWAMAREELSKSKGGTAYSAMKRIVSKAYSRSDFDGAWIDSEGRQCVCDGYRAVRLKKPVSGLPDAKGMDLDKVFTDMGDSFRPLPLPTPGELKICIAEQKGRERKFYDFGEEMPYVNAAYLKDVMDALPNAEAFYDTEHPYTGAIRFVAPGGDAVLLPVRKSD